MHQEGWFHRLFRPRRTHNLPYTRVWKIGLRSLHLIVISILVGGHFFGAPAGQLRPLLYAAIVTGGGMIFFEAYPSPHFMFEGWGLLLLGKLALLCVIPFAWDYRGPILVVVTALASIGSHRPARFRHYSVLYRRVVKE